ncbi:MAG: hypothetical protein P8Y27_04965 [Chromatiaceae bacterium]
MGTPDFEATVTLLAEIGFSSITVRRLLKGQSYVTMHVGKAPQIACRLTRDTALSLSRILAVAASAEET